MGQTRIDPQTGLHQCVFCPELSPTADHLESHNFQACHEKTLAERTFYRKDHLRQHLRLMHGVKFDPHMDTWKSTTFTISSKCGFCPSVFNTWQARADHLAAHFRNGADMKTWSGGWGFEPYIERLVENAIPPYLIGQDRQTMNPFRARELVKTSPSDTATNTNTATTSPNTGICTDYSPDRVEVDQMTKDSNCWRRLEEELIKFTIEQRSQGNVPTDEDIRNKARIIVYGDPDPWDWTMADNQTWLDAFKHEQGLCSLAELTINPATYSSTQCVPVMAPYVVKGGLKTKKVPIPPHSGHCGTARSVGHRGSTASLPGVQERGCSGPGLFSSSRNSSSFTGGTPITPLMGTSFEEAAQKGKQPPADADAMNFDFDAIDFTSLDLNAFGEMEFGEAAGQAFPVTTGMMMDISPQYAPVHGQPMDMGMDAHAGLGSRMGVNTGDSGGMQAQKRLSPSQRNMFDDMPEMSLEAFDQLTGYMAGFR